MEKKSGKPFNGIVLSSSGREMHRKVGVTQSCLTRLQKNFMITDLPSCAGNEGYQDDHTVGYRARKSCIQVPKCLTCHCIDREGLVPEKEDNGEKEKRKCRKNS